MITDRGVRAGPGAWRTIRDGLAGTVVVGVAGGVYVTTTTRQWLLVTGPRALLGPLTLQLARPVRAQWRPGEPVGVSDGVLTIGSDQIDVREVRVDPVPLMPECAPDAAATMACACAILPRPPAALLPGLAALAAGDTAAAVVALAGRGDGLTPAGDDILAGYCAWRRADAAVDPDIVLELARPRATPLGLAYLHCATRGELVDVAARLMAAVRGAELSLVVQRARALSGWGASSGAAVCWGMDAALRRHSLEPTRRDRGPDAAGTPAPVMVIASIASARRVHADGGCEAYHLDPQ
jgi:Protein of unknown function (DUF2877)